MHELNNRHGHKTGSLVILYRQHLHWCQAAISMCMRIYMCMEVSLDRSRPCFPSLCMGWRFRSKDRCRAHSEMQERQRLNLRLTLTPLLAHPGFWHTYLGTSKKCPTESHQRMRIWGNCNLALCSPSLLCLQAVPSKCCSPVPTPICLPPQAARVAELLQLKLIILLTYRERLEEAVAQANAHLRLYMRPPGESHKNC